MQRRVLVFLVLYFGWPNQPSSGTPDGENLHGYTWLLYREITCVMTKIRNGLMRFRLTV